MLAWPFLVVGSAALQVVRNAAQRDLVARLGVWAASYVRFIYGLPFACLWAAAILAWRGPSGGANGVFFAWVLLGALTQMGAAAALVRALSGRGFAAATALSKTEVLGTALLGVWMLRDHMSVAQWVGAAAGTAGVVLMLGASVNRDAMKAAAAGAGSGVLFAVASVAYRAAAHAWGGDAWVGAALALVSTLAMQTLIGGAILAAFSRRVFVEVLHAWRTSLRPGAAGAGASALLFTAFAIGPSAGAVKTLQLVDMLIAGVVSRQMFREKLRPIELFGAVLVLLGAAGALMA